jgi:hypothetical protein
VRKAVFNTLAVVAALALRPAESRADFSSITFTNLKAANTGTGFGSIESILQLQTANGSSTIEYGAVAWNGSADVTSGTKTGGAPHSETLQVASDLLSAGGANIKLNADGSVDFVVIFQVNQSGATTLDLHTFQLDFFKADGTQALASLKYTDGSPSSAALGGVGVGTSGWIFDVHLDSADASAFFGTGTNRLGMSVLSGNGKQIDNVANDGPDNFYIAARQSVNVVPVPPSALLLGVGGLCCAGLAARARRQRLSAAA